MQYSKCVFLDADTLVMSNVDELFEREELSAASDVGWPDLFNSGVFVFTPSQATFSALKDLAKQEGSYDGKSISCSTGVGNNSSLFWSCLRAFTVISAAYIEANWFLSFI